MFRQEVTGGFEIWEFKILGVDILNILNLNFLSSVPKLPAFKREVLKISCFLHVSVDLDDFEHYFNVQFSNSG